MSSKGGTEDVSILDPPTRAVILGAMSATGMYIISRQGCGLTKTSSILLASILFMVIMNYYLPLHRALVSKHKHVHMYWYVTLVLTSLVLIITIYLALSDREKCKTDSQAYESNIMYSTLLP